MCGFFELFEIVIVYYIRGLIAASRYLIYTVEVLTNAYLINTKDAAIYPAKLMGERGFYDTVIISLCN